MAGPSSSAVIKKADRTRQRRRLSRKNCRTAASAAASAALHIGGAAAIKHAAFDFGREGRMPPGRLVARRHDIGMAREADVRRAGADAGIEVVHVGRAVLAEGKPVAYKARGRKLALQIAERARLPPG